MTISNCFFLDLRDKNKFIEFNLIKRFKRKKCQLVVFNGIKEKKCKETTRVAVISVGEKDFPLDLFQLADNKLQDSRSTFTPQALSTTY